MGIPILKNMSTIPESSAKYTLKRDSSTEFKPQKNLFTENFLTGQINSSQKKPWFIGIKMIGL